MFNVEIDQLKEVWYSTKSIESAQASIETQEEQLCEMGKIVEALTEPSVKEAL